MEVVLPLMTLDDIGHISFLSVKLDGYEKEDLQNQELECIEVIDAHLGELLSSLPKDSVDYERFARVRHDLFIACEFLRGCDIRIS
jgi:hypothetical protein